MRLFISLILLMAILCMTVVWHLYVRVVFVLFSILNYDNGLSIQSDGNVFNIFFVAFSLQWFSETKITKKKKKNQKIRNSACGMDQWIVNDLVVCILLFLYVACCAFLRLILFFHKQTFLSPRFLLSFLIIIASILVFGFLFRFEDFVLRHELHQTRSMYAFVLYVYFFFVNYIL